MRLFLNSVLFAIVTLLFNTAIEYALAQQPNGQQAVIVRQGNQILQPQGVQQGAQQDGGMELFLGEDAIVDLEALVAQLARSQGLRIQVRRDQFPGGQQNIVKVYGDLGKISAEDTFEYTQSILRAAGFAIVKAEKEGDLQVVKLADARPFTPFIESGGEKNYGNAEYVTGLFPLTHIAPAQAKDYITEMLYGATNPAKDNVGSIRNRNVLIVTETKDKISRIAQLLPEIDVPTVSVTRKFYDVKNGEAQDLKQQLQQILGTDSDLSDPQSPVARPTVQNSASQLKIDAILRSNQLLLSGSESQIQDALKLLADLDVATQLTVKTYQFEHVSPKQIDDLARRSLGGVSEKDLEQLYSSTVNEQTNGLVVTTRPEIHARVERLKQQLDVEEIGGAARSPIRFYTLKNVKAIDVLDTLQSVERRYSGRDSGFNGSDRFDSFNRPGIGRRDGQNLRRADSLRGDTVFDSDDELREQEFRRRSQAIQSTLADSTLGGLGAQNLTGAGGQFGNQVIPGDAKVTVDETTNTLIVVAEPDIQRLYAELIKRLDVRRPQVLIEAIIVSVTDEDIYNLGIEISGGDREGANRLFSFTNFNLNDGVDGETGALTIRPGLGFNGTLVDPDTADLIVRALARHNNARVVAAPRILVNDNSTGVLSSVQEIPFVGSTVGNQGTSTNLGGFAQAGTSLSVTPQISDDDYLNLEFDITVNNFLGTVDQGSPVPPSRATDQVTSEVTIPDGHTVIVGGLKRRRSADDLIGLPIIERIPILNRLTSNQSDNVSEERLFVFIKPVILRDDKFKDLRFLSDLERQAAKIPGDFPESSPVLIR